MTRSRRVLIGVPVAAVLLAAASWTAYRQWGQRKPAPAPAAAKPDVYTGGEVTLNGTIMARNVVPVAAPMDGVIDSLFAEAGQEVVQGQLLAHISSAKLDAALEAARLDFERVETRVANIESAIIAARLEVSRANADAARAKSDFDRVAKLFERQEFLMKEGATPRLVYEKAQKEFAAAQQEFDNKTELLRQAQGELDRLNRDLDAAKRALEEKTSVFDQAKADVSAGDLVSPVDGVVIAHKGQPGEEITPTVADFFQIAVDLGTLDVAVDPPPPVLARVKPGQQATVHIADFPENLAGKVREIRGSQVLVEFASPSPYIKPTMTATVLIRLD